MKRRTYNNMVKAVNMLMAKGYDCGEANSIAIQCFDNAEQAKNGMPVEWWLDKIIPKAEYEAQYQN